LMGYFHWRLIMTFPTSLAQILPLILVSDIDSQHFIFLFHFQLQLPPVPVSCSLASSRTDHRFIDHHVLHLCYQCRSGRASYELGRILGGGEVIGELQISWDELLDHGDKPFSRWLALHSNFMHIC
jgi:hypothetical protein